MSVGIDLERFCNFKDAEFRSIDIISQTEIKLTFATQDSARDFDWITVALEFNGISDAKLLKESHISLVDMSDGISIIKDENRFAFAIGECYNISTIKSASCFIIASSLKYQEGLF